MNPIAWFQGRHGTTLVVASTILMFVEEVGVPLPFAPGDLVLAVGGIAIAGGRVNPLLLVGAVAISVTAGAIIGRAVAELLGWDRLMRIAQPLHARGALERAAGLLQRGGWRTVFTARLISRVGVDTAPGAGVGRRALRPFFPGLVSANAGFHPAGFGTGGAFRPP